MYVCVQKLVDHLVAPLLKQISVLLQQEWCLALDAKAELEYLGNLIVISGNILKEANSKEVINGNLKAYIKQNSPQLYADHANSSSACQWSSSIAFSEENDDALVGIGEAREPLVQWLTENDSMLKVIFVHGEQGVGKTSLVSVVLRDQKVRSHFKYYVWIMDLRSLELVKDKMAVLTKAKANMWDLTKNNDQESKSSLKRVLQNYETTLDIAAAMQNSPQLSADYANSSSACQWSSSIAFSEENDNGLVGIGEAREQLVQWLTENDSMLKVIFVHGAQGVGKTSLVGVVLRDQRAKAKMWDLTKNNNQEIQVELEEVFKRIRNDYDLRNNNYIWVLVLDDAARLANGHRPIAFSEENDDGLVGIGEAREQLVQWLTENDSMLKVIFVHDPWELFKGKMAVLTKAKANMWDLTKNNDQEIQVELEEVFKRMRNDYDLRNNNYIWVLVLNDSGREHMFESLRSHLDQTRPSVLVTSRVSSLALKVKGLMDSLWA
ncbi:hypothetical protein NL676_009761 [Syzygium grande]|nr:hypothetical protein NL676_009761 [Syzygium grande]